MAYFHAKNPNLSIFWRALEWKMWVYIVIWNIVQPFGTHTFVLSGHFVNFVVIWYIFHLFGTFQQEKSGNPGSNRYFCSTSTAPFLTMVNNSAVY
jgi:hypothetical protein